MALQIQSTVPSATRWKYIIVGVLCCSLLAVYFLTQHYPSGTVPSTIVLDKITGIVLVLIAIVSIVRITRKVEWYDDKVVRKSILGTKTTTYKQIAGYYLDGSTTNSIDTTKGSGYFRGVMMRKKDGSRFVLYKAELTNFEQLDALLKTRCKKLQKKAVAKIVKKEDRKVFFLIVGAISLIILSLLH